MSLNRIKPAILIFLLLSATAVLINSCVHAPYVLPVSERTGDPTICFERDVLPIFIANCTRSGCHNAQDHRSGYALDSYQDIMKKGIVPGNTAASVIWESIAIKTWNVSHMPVDGSINATQLDVIKRWIQTGAIDSGACNATCDSNNYTFSGSILPLIQLYCTGCHNSPSAAGGALTDYSTIQTAAVSGRLIGDIEHLSGYNAMPLGGAQLSDCQIAQVKKWVAAGALNN